MKWLKRILIALAMLLVMAVALPFFITLDDYIPEIQRQAGVKLKEPVTIKSIRFGALPLPHVTLEGIAVGKADDIRLGKLVVIPDLYSLLQPVRVIRRIEIDSLALTQRGLEIVGQAAKPEADKPEQKIRLEQVNLRNARFIGGKLELGSFNAQVSFSASGGFGEAAINSADGKLKALVKSGQQGYPVEISASAWRLPSGPPLLFDELIVKGVATPNAASLSQISAKLYGGAVSGKVKISWQKGWQLNGSLDINQVEVQQIVAMLSPNTHLSGKLAAKPVFSASAVSPAQLANALRLETPFNLQNGILQGVDIQQAASNPASKRKTGGETRFDELSGHLLMAQNGYRFTDLKIASGALAADGNVNISAKKALSGRINAQVKALGVSTNVPLNVSGTVESPLLYPTGGTMAGAAVGTVLMGPGVGTSVGAKAGSWAENLFGSKAENKPKNKAR